MATCGFDVGADIGFETNYGSPMNSEDFGLFEEASAEHIVSHCRANSNWTARDAGRVLFQVLKTLDISPDSLSLEQVKDFLVATQMIAKQIVPADRRGR